MMFPATAQTYSLNVDSGFLEPGLEVCQNCSILAVNYSQSPIDKEGFLYLTCESLSNQTFYYNLGQQNHATDFIQYYCPDIVKINGGSQNEWSSSIVFVAGELKDSKVLIQNTTTSAEFYLDKSLNYGEAIIIWFLTIFTFYIIFRTAYNFFWKK